MLSAIKVGGNVTTGIIFLLEKVFWKIMLNPVVVSPESPTS